MNLAAGRVPCCIFGCRRTFKKDVADMHRPVEDLEYMCGDDYRRVDPVIRRLRAKLRRRARKSGWTAQLEKIDNWLWHRAKRQATERRMGI